MTTTTCPKCYGTNGHHNTLHERYGNGAGGNMPCPLDPKGPHPMTPNDHNDSYTTVEGPHMTTPHPGKRTPEPTIPMAVKELTLKRSPYPRDGGRFTVTAEGIGWSGTFLAKPEDVFTRLQEVAAIMEAQK